MPRKSTKKVIPEILPIEQNLSTLGDEITPEPTSLGERLSVAVEEALAPLQPVLAEAGADPSEDTAEDAKEEGEQEDHGDNNGDDETPPGVFVAVGSGSGSGSGAGTGAGRSSRKSGAGVKRSNISPSHRHERDRHPGQEQTFRFLPLAIIVLLLMIGVAAGGVYMFAKKSALLGVNTDEDISGDVLNAVNGAASTPPRAPATTVNLSFYLSTTTPATTQKSAKPFLKTRLLETDVKMSDSFAATGTAATQGKSTGTVTVVNTASRAFTFVATTRFLSKEGVLFRLKSALAVPANSSVDAVIVADKPGPAGDIAPTTFTVPGLAPAMQTLVYGKSSASMTGGAGVAKAVAAQDIATAKGALLAKLKTTAKANFASMVTKDEKIVEGLIASTELAFVAPSEGVAGDTFTATLSVRFRLLPVPESLIIPLLQGQKQQLMSTQGLIGNYTLGAPTYMINAFDTKVNQAEVQAQVEVQQK